MKFKLITDSHDAVTGMRLAGIEGVAVKGAAQAEQEIKNAMQDPEIGIVLVTQGLAQSCGELISSLKLGSGNKLIVTVPGSKDEKASDDIMQYVREAVGIKL